MKTWLKVLLITLVVAVPAFVLGPILWPPTPHGPAPVGVQLLLFMLLAALESLALGLGVALIIYSLPLVRTAKGPRTRTWMTFIATVWLLISWWPHDNMHKNNGMDINGLLIIDYLFHVPMMVAGVILAYNLVQAIRMPASTGQTSIQPVAHGATGD